MSSEDRRAELDAAITELLRRTPPGMRYGSGPFPAALRRVVSAVADLRKHGEDINPKAKDEAHDAG